MILRPYNASDAPTLRRIHEAQGYTFEMPELSDPDIVSAWVAEDAGQVITAVAARAIPEITVLVDGNFQTPAWRLEVLQQLQQKVAADLSRKGYTQMQSFVKPSIWGFGRRLVKSLGWIRSQGGECFVRSL